MTAVVHTDSVATEDFQHQWEQWHREHETAIGDRHGFLAVTSLNWLTESPQRFPDAPGSWYTDQAGVHVDLTGDEEIVVDGVVTRGRHDFGIIAERASLTVGWEDVVLEIGKRGGFDILRP